MNASAVQIRGDRFQSANTLRSKSSLRGRRAKFGRREGGEKWGESKKVKVFWPLSVSAFVYFALRVKKRDQSRLLQLILDIAFNLCLFRSILFLELLFLRSPLY